MRTLTPFLFLSLAALACSSEDDSPETREAFCERWAQAACSDEVVSACQAAGPEDCQQSQEEVCLAKIPATGFSGERADSCIDAVRAAYEDGDITSAEIDTVLRFAAPCDQLVRGSAGDGDSCSTRADCDAPAGFDCVFKGEQTLGTCRLPAPVGAGEDCSAPAAVCGEGFYCNGDNCIAGERIGDPCVTNRQCGRDGFCGLTSQCEERYPLNATCGFDEQCDSGVCYAFSTTETVCTDRVVLSRTDPLCATLR